MKFYCKPAGSDEPWQELPDVVEPFTLHPSEEEEEPTWGVAEINPETLCEFTGTPKELIWRGEVTYTPEDIRKLRRMMKPRKYPRKLKKAIGQMWTKKWDGASWGITFIEKRKTKWQRKACGLIDKRDDYILFPMKNGYSFVIKLEEHK